MTTARTSAKPKDYRELLKSAFSQRMEKNPSYSFRAFARDVGLNHSLLHEALKKKKGLSGKAAQKIGERLGWTARETELFVARVEAEHSRSELARQNARAKVERLEQQTKYSHIREDMFRLIKDWYHNAILELTYLDDFDSSLAWIAARLEISQLEAEQAVDRLLKLGLLERTKGRLRATEDYSRVDSDIPSEAIRRSHEQVMTKAKQALYFQALHERDFLAATLSMHSSDIKKAKEAIRAFVNDFSDKFGQKNKRDAVFNLSLQLFRLDKRAHEKP